MDPSAVSRGDAKAYHEYYVGQMEKLRGEIENPPRRLKCMLSKKPMDGTITTLIPCLCNFDTDALNGYTKEHNIQNLTKCPQCENFIEGSSINEKMRNLVTQWQEILSRQGFIWNPMAGRDSVPAIAAMQQTPLPELAQPFPPSHAPANPMPIPFAAEQQPAALQVPIIKPPTPPKATQKRSDEDLSSEEDGSPIRKGKKAKPAAAALQEATSALNALHQMISRDDSTTKITKLVKKNPSFILEKDEEGNNCLMAYIKRRQVAHKMVALMLENCKEININEQNNEGQTALHLAALKANSQVIELLMSQGADKTIKDFKGKTAIEYVHARLSHSFTKGARSSLQ